MYFQAKITVYHLNVLATLTDEVGFKRKQILSLWYNRVV